MLSGSLAADEQRSARLNAFERHWRCRTGDLPCSGRGSQTWRSPCPLPHPEGDRRPLQFSASPIIRSVVAITAWFPEFQAGCRRALIVEKSGRATGEWLRSRVRQPANRGKRRPVTARPSKSFEGCRHIIGLFQRLAGCAQWQAGPSTVADPLAAITLVVIGLSAATCTHDLLLGCGLYAAIVGASVGAIMEIASQSADRVLLLGPLQVIQNRAQLPLPPSRKVRGLLAYLAMAPRPVTREKLCELFWDVADDPKSELRWCLSSYGR